MKISVMKFGGIALANPHNQSMVIDIITASKNKNIIICSAMGRMGYAYSTDSLLELVTGNITLKEKDRLLACGEIISSIRLSSLLNEKMNAYALSCNEIGILCDNNYGKGNIKSFIISHIEQLLQKYDNLIIPGFIALSNEREVITLGRGNSDLSAVVIAINLGLSKTTLYKDVAGVYHTSPSQYQQFYKYEFISYDEMLALNHIGFQLVSEQAIIEAKKNNLIVEIKSFKENISGTLISSKAADEIYLGFNFDKKMVYIATFFPCLVKEQLAQMLANNHIFIKNEVIEEDYYAFEISKSVQNIIKKLLLSCFKPNSAQKMTEKQ